MASRYEIGKLCHTHERDALFVEDLHRAGEIQQRVTQAIYAAETAVPIADRKALAKNLICRANRYNPIIPIGLWGVADPYVWLCLASSSETAQQWVRHTRRRVSDSRCPDCPKELLLFLVLRRVRRSLR